ncbi:MAG: methyltransferase [Flavobacteriaceae bacterium]|nr:methyltransferase [Flavobacteriaceae bacterium]|tara:strand:+ start:877 stop:1536 length:660 start_codon:yes stop_codon:yes gene_type:complete
MIRKLLKKISHPFLKYGTESYFSKPRSYKYEGIEVMVMPEVFPPHYTLSTKILLDCIKQLDITNKTFLELGCGSGIISLYATSKGAMVTASDINSVALEALNKASKKNNLDVEILNSDLFNNISENSFDYIIINPPYYPKVPKNTKERAWFCGKDFEYFQELFQQLSHRDDKTILMILSQDCDLTTIKKIASENHFQLIIEQERANFAERNFIFNVSKI